MSSIPASAPALGTRVSVARRPSTLVVYRWELRKLISQKRTYLGFGLAMLLPTIFVVSQLISPHHDRNGSIFEYQLRGQSGYLP